MHATSNGSAVQPAQRKTPSLTGAWCWQEKRILRAIREYFDSTRDVTSGIAIYTALTEIASDKQSDTYTERIARIASRAGVSYRTAVKVLGRFEEIGFITVKRHRVPNTKEHSPSTYTLCKSCSTLGNECITLCNDGKRSTLPKRLKNRESKSKKNAEEVSSNNTNKLSGIVADAEAGVINGEQFLSKLKTHFPHIDIQKEHRRYLEWHRKHGYPPTHAGFVKWLDRTKPEFRVMPQRPSRSSENPSQYQRVLEASIVRADRVLMGDEESCVSSRIEKRHVHTARKGSSQHEYKRIVRATRLGRETKPEGG